MKEKEINLIIIKKLIEKGYEIKNIERNYFTVENKTGIEFNISYEMCMCHGGRLTISSKHVEHYKRFEDDFYDKEKGITDAESELLYHIEHDMINEMENVDKYIYKVIQKRPGYYKNKEEVKYYMSPNDISHRIINEDIDIFTITERTITFPNKNRIDKVENINYKEGVLSFEVNGYEREDEEDEFIKRTDDISLETYIVSVIRK